MERFGRETKEYMIKELKMLFEKHPNVFVANFSNLKVPELQQLRASLKNISAKYMIVKNTIAHQALSQMKRKEIMGMVEGMCGVVLIGEDPIVASKVLMNFRRNHEALDIRGGFLDGAVISSDKIKELSNLPSKNVLLGMVVSRIYSPVTGFVNSLAGLIRKLIYVINAIKEKTPKKDGAA